MLTRRSLISSIAASALAANRASALDASPFVQRIPGPQYNWGSSNFSFWRAAKARVRSGAGRAKILCVGDSTTAGVGGGSAQGIKSVSYPTALATSLASLGLPSNNDNFYGTANQSPYGTYNTQVVVGSGWAASGTTAGASGFGNSTTNNPLSFTPASPVDTFELTYLTNTGNGLLSFDIDGGSATNIDCNQAIALNKRVITTSLGSHTLNLKWVSGGAVTIFGVLAYNSQNKAVDVVNMGWGSSTTTDWNNNSNAFRPRPAIQFQQADLIIIELGINDWTPATLVDVPTYITNLSALVSDNIASSTILFATPISSIASRQTWQIQQNYVSAMYGVAQANNLPVWDLWNKWGVYPQSSSFYYADGVHGNSSGYSEEGSGLASALFGA